MSELSGSSQSPPPINFPGSFYQFYLFFFMQLIRKYTEAMLRFCPIGLSLLASELRVPDANSLFPVHIRHSKVAEYWDMD